MTERSYWWTAGGAAGDGANTYTRTDLANVVKVLSAVRGPEGVSFNYLNKFASSLSTNTLTLNTGAAIVDGKPYLSDASVNVTIPSASGGGNTRIDRVVLRADWAAQTVRITRIAGTDAASPTAPALTQTPGSTYDLPLYQVRVNTSGTVTVEVDERPFDRVAPVVKRQGGHASNWNVVGTTNYTPNGAKIQVGTFQLTGSGGISGDTITFPEAFSAAPLVVACFASSLYSNRTLGVANETTTNFTAIARDSAGAQQSAVITWFAIGPA